MNVTGSKTQRGVSGGLKVLRVKPGPAVFVAFLADPLWFWLHWIGNRTFAHLDTDCPYCNGNGMVEKGYAPALRLFPLQNQQDRPPCKVIAELPSVEQLPEVFAGRVFRLERKPEEGQELLQVTLERNIGQGKLPEAFPILPRLLALWGHVPAVCNRPAIEKFQPRLYPESRLG